MDTGTTSNFIEMSPRGLCKFDSILLLPFDSGTNFFNFMIWFSSLPFI